MIPVGVMWQGPWRKRSDGFAKHTREQALALARYLPVNLATLGVSSLMDHELDPEVLAEAGYLQNIHATHYPLAIRQMIFNTSDYVFGVLRPPGARLVSEELQQQVVRSSIVYTSWERDRVHPDIIEALSGIADLWVPCEANLQAFVQSGMDLSRVHVMPYPYEPSTHLTTQIPLPRGHGLVPSYKRFYAIGKWEPRKDYDRLIGAFLLAFTPRDRVCLTLKTFGYGKWSNYPSLEESGRKWVNDPAVVARGWTPKSVNRVVRFLDEELTDAEIADLHRTNNIYVSSSHGEAFDIPAFDAMCAGNSLVHIGYGGTADYARCATKLQSVSQVPWKFGQVHPDYKWEPDARWAEYELSDLVTALQMVSPPEERMHPPRLGAFSRQNVGRMMADRIYDILGESNVNLAGELMDAGCFG
jgi:glycosyltransferase involved in cell wall biosynthesis